MLRIQNDQKEYVCVVHVESHDFKCCSSLPRLKEVHQEDNGASKLPMQQCYVTPRGPWQPIQPDMMQELNSKFQGYANPPQSNWNTPFPWQHWPSQSQSQSWQQGWKGTYGSHPQYR